jgi:hypothetical protein
MMGWKTGNEHPSTGSGARVGLTHTDTYHTNAAGKRDQPHGSDLKVSGPKFKFMKMISRKRKPHLIISHERVKNDELQWTDQEKLVLEARIVSLRKDQIAALLEITGLKFHKPEIDQVAQEIKADGLRSGHLEILLAEANSRADLLWWIDYFENANK